MVPHKSQPEADDGDFIMISALQHYLFCPRQCALIHLEQLWSENFLTTAGKVLHDRVDKRKHETRKDVHLATALRLINRQLQLTGVADLVEFHKTTDETIGIKLKTQSGYWIPYPVEYKHGKPKKHRADEVQLCAQALCLEEMLQVNIPKGALYYGETRRRTDVNFDQELRTLTTEIIYQIHELLRSGKTPPPNYTNACHSCSLIERCQPECVSSHKSAKAWIDSQIEAIIK